MVTNVVCNKIANMSEVICALTRHETANILQGHLTKTLAMSKSLFKKCNIKVKIIQEESLMFTDLVTFLFHEKQDQVQGNIVTH